MTIHLTQMSFYYDEYFHPIFDDVNLSLDLNWKLGLIGRNGRGKTTLLKLIHKLLEPTTGQVHVPVKTELFPYVYDAKGTTLEVVKKCVAPFYEWEDQMHIYEEEMASGNYEHLHTFGEILEKYTDAEGFIMDELIEKEFNLMGLDLNLLEMPYEILSGGEQTKIQIIAMFLKKHRFMLLDEPTNHLDLDGRQTLADYLNQKSGFIVVSHDRAFVDEVVDHILSINKNNIYIEKGCYSSWQSNKDRQDYHEYRVNEKLKREIRNLEEASKRSRKWSSDKEAEKIGSGGDKGYIGARAARLMKRAISFEKRIQKDLEVKKDLLKNVEVTRPIIVKQDALESDLYMEVMHIACGYENNLVIDDLSFTLNRGDRIWIKGKNGSGKTTLLKAIIGDLTLEKGTIHCAEGVKMVYSSQSPRWRDGYLLDRMKEEGIERHWFQMVLNYFDITEAYYDRPIEAFSEGEKKKIDIARSLMGREHILIWDEPLNYVDVTIRKQIEDAIMTYQPTMIFVEHDQYFGEHIATHEIDLSVDS
ncbi:MAG: ABC-F family ATP-binding cassette domain-containing protein [Clostridia bacterium]|nr:ABC-F family ATP-binding cassette domain-containing protein [Clostridia bacterium]